MGVELLWTAQAEEDVLEIYHFIALDNLKAADRILVKLEARVEVLVDHPRLGLRKPEIRPSTRISFSMKRTLIQTKARLTL